MAILSDVDIKKQMELGNIKIDGFDEKDLNPNSVDVHLGKHLFVYRSSVLDCKKENEGVYVEIPDHGILLVPGELYLGVTKEYTETFGLVPIFEGKSSLGRLGLDVHISAGFGDNGFCGHWTLELRVVRDLIIYPYMPIGQIVYHELKSYGSRYDKIEKSKYNNKEGMPIPSKFYKNFN
jgi:dCTP deaminase